MQCRSTRSTQRTRSAGLIVVLFRRGFKMGNELKDENLQSRLI